MKAKELRIGNYVTNKWNSSFMLVDSINEKGIDLRIEDDGNWPELAVHKIEPYYTFDELKPIELIEELLLKCGFVFNDNAYFSTPRRNDSIKIVGYDGHYYFIVNKLKSIRIKHLHQLQNLYFALTNQELKIKLKIEL